jgi:hypothetical protein
MSLSLPGPMEPSDDERESLMTFLRAKRGDVVRAADGLDEVQVHRRPAPGFLPIIGIINHLARMEERWIDGRYLGVPFPDRTDEFDVDPTIPASVIVDAYEQRATQSDAAISSAPSLLVHCVGREGDKPPAHVLLGLASPINLRWVILHLVEETAHHAGHADATRSLIDGKSSAELLAVARARVD